MVPKRWLKWAGLVPAIPIGLFFLTAILIYVPPIQNWIKSVVMESLSKEMNMAVSIERLRLAFPLDFVLNKTLVVEGRDTIVAAEYVRLDARLLPLLNGKVELNELQLCNARLDTKDKISDTHIKGRIGFLGVQSPAMFRMDLHAMELRRLMLRNSDVQVVLSDTGAVDTTRSEPTKLKIRVSLADFHQTHLFIRLPGDSLRIDAFLGGFRMEEGYGDVGAVDYGVKRLSIRQSNIDYDIPYASRCKGFDVNHIKVRDLSLRLDTARYAAGHIAAAIRRLSFQERCGIAVEEMNAEVAYDSLSLIVPSMHICTAHSNLSAKVKLPWNALKVGTSCQMEVNAKGTIRREDVMCFMPNIMRDTLNCPKFHGLDMELDAKGNLGEMNVRKAVVKLPSYFEIDVNGRMQNCTKENMRNGKLHYSIKTGTHPIHQLMPKTFSEVVHIPKKMDLTGVAEMRGEAYCTNALMKVGSGNMSLDGSYAPRSEKYEFKIHASQFPIGLFFPNDSLSALTARIDAKGRGFDFFSTKTRLFATADIRKFRIGTMPLDSVRLNAEVNNGGMNCNLEVLNAMIHGNMNLKGNVVEKNLKLSLQGGVDDLCMRYLVSENDSLHLATGFKLNANVNKDGIHLKSDGIIDKIRIMTPSRDYLAKYGLRYEFETSDKETMARMLAGDLSFHVKMDQSLSDAVGKFGAFVDTMLCQVKNRMIDEVALTAMLPNMVLGLVCGKNNPFRNTLSFMGYQLDSMDVDLHTDAKRGLNGNMKVMALKTGDLLLDDTNIQIFHDTVGMKVNCDINNRSKRNPNKFRAHFQGCLSEAGIGVETKYFDEEDKEGLNMGVRLQMSQDGEMSIHMFPEIATIAYRKFKINKDNFITLRKDSSICANLSLLADDNTGLKIDTPEGDSLRELSVSMHNVNLRELTHVLPFMPSLGGLLDGDFHAKWEKRDVSATGAVNVKDLYYENAALGNVSSEMLYLPKAANEHQVVVNLSRNHQEIVNIEGLLMTNEVDSIFAEAKLMRFPADMLNGFMGEDGTLALSGFLKGEVQLSGELSKMRMNGHLETDSLCVLSSVYGISMKVEDKSLSIEDNKILVDGVKLLAEKNNPLNVSGNIDIADLSNIKLDLGFKAKNFQIVNAHKTKQSIVFGKVFVNLDAALKGNTSLMRLKGDIDVLGNTNVTYIMKDSPLTVEDRLEGLVEFVDFSDTATVSKTEFQPIGGLFMNMKIRMSDATKLRCEFSSDASSYFNCEGGGILAMRYTPAGNFSLSGRFSMNSGEMKYALPFIPLKTFKLKEGSFINFTGDPMNPTLNITAMETLRTVVNDKDEQGRIVKFDVGVSITQTLNDMGLEFLIDAPEDISVQNELKSMTKEERGKLAVGVLATGAYLSSSNKSAFKATNALNAFLQSEIQNLAGNALKSVDFSVDVSGNTNAKGNYRTDYSFQFAKRFWNDRITIRIGGKVSSGRDEKNKGESFIDNISLECRLGNSTSRHLLLFYENNRKDPLEGRYTAAGGGFLWRRKVDRLGELFLFRSERKEKENAETGHENMEKDEK